MLTREDRNAIDGLFERLQEAERRGGPRDAEAESYIRSKVAAQPSAHYYLAQTVVVQQEALKEAERRIEALERNGRQIEQRRGPWDRDPADDGRRQNAGGGFLAGAAQTALGVAGGMMLGSLIGSIFTSGAANASEYDNGVNDTSTEGSDPGGDAGGDDGGFDGGGFDMGGDF
jgi:hypothetical protein